MRNQIGLDLPSPSTIADSADLMNLVRHELSYSKTDKLPAEGNLPRHLFALRRAQIPLRMRWDRNFSWCQAGLLNCATCSPYVEAKQKQTTLDYDDLLALLGAGRDGASARRRHGSAVRPTCSSAVSGRNRLQAAILLALKPGGRGLAVVGDDAQSIYSFRAAGEKHSGLPRRVLAPAPASSSRSTNYRSSAAHPRRANGVIAGARQRFADLWTERTAAKSRRSSSVRDEGRSGPDYIVAQVLESREAGASLKQQAVLFTPRIIRVR